MVPVSCAATAGALHTNDVSFSTTAATGAECSPKRHSISRPEKWLPVSRTGTEPVTGPDAGHSDATSGSGRYVNVTPLVACGTSSSELSTETVTSPAAPSGAGGVRHCTAVSSMKIARVEAPPTPKRHRSDTMCAKLTPRTVMSVPPCSGPVVGSTVSVCAGPCTCSGTPDTVKSSPFRLTSTTASPTGITGVTQWTAVGDR
mmetsp:Transcript_8635/g.30638  ORF Transcript_8635/g.30638 Transcript_8635/m.30638 type:complete len:202 (+) Transcript_8635:3530-4135(+)